SSKTELTLTMQSETNKTSKTSLEIYSQLLSVRDALKPVTQISWTIKNLEKQVSLDQLDIKLVSTGELVAFLNLYLGFIEDVEHSHNRLQELKKQIKQIKQNEAEIHEVRQ